MNGTKKTPQKVLLALLMALFSVFLFSGCYTKLMSYQGEAMLGRSGSGCEDGCPEEVAVSRDRREICVWERDIFGYPEMRCYNTYYHSSWMYFHSTPWWYRSSFGWYDTRGCPPHYYYDRFTGRCRYYGNTYPPPNSGVGGSGGSMPGQRPRPSPRSIPYESPAAAESSSSEQPMFSGSSLKTLSPAPAPVQSQPSSQQPQQSGSSGGSSGMTKPQEEAPPPPPPPAPERNPNERPRPRGRGM